MRFTLLAGIGFVALIAACATPGSRYPGAAQCPAFATYDPAALHRAGDPSQNERVATYDDWTRGRVADVPVPAEAANATTRIRVRVPPTGMWPVDDLVTAWKDEEGRWFIARRRLDFSAPPPPPTPPSGASADWRPSPDPPLEERFPLLLGPADATTVARLNAALEDPCMNAEPTRFSSMLPRREGSDWVCVPDSSAMAAEIVEPGGRVRLIAIACENELATSDFIRFVYGAAGIEPGRVETRTSW